MSEIKKTCVVCGSVLRDDLEDNDAPICGVQDVAHLQAIDAFEKQQEEENASVLDEGSAAVEAEIEAAEPQAGPHKELSLHDEVRPNIAPDETKYAESLSANEDIGGDLPARSSGSPLKSTTSFVQRPDQWRDDEGIPHRAMRTSQELHTDMEGARRLYASTQRCARHGTPHCSSCYQKPRATKPAVDPAAIIRAKPIVRSPGKEERLRKHPYAYMSPEEETYEVIATAKALGLPFSLIPSKIIKQKPEPKPAPPPKKNRSLRKELGLDPLVIAAWLDIPFDRWIQKPASDSPPVDSSSPPPPNGAELQKELDEVCAIIANLEEHFKTLSKKSSPELSEKERRRYKRAVKDDLRKAEQHKKEIKRRSDGVGSAVPSPSVNKFLAEYEAAGRPGWVEDWVKQLAAKYQTAARTGLGIVGDEFVDFENAVIKRWLGAGHIVEDSDGPVESEDGALENKLISKTGGAQIGGRIYGGKHGSTPGQTGRRKGLETFDRGGSRGGGQNGGDGGDIHDDYAENSGDDIDRSD